MSTKLQSVAFSVVALGAGAFLLVLAAQRADEIDFAAVAKLLGLAAGFVFLALFVIGALALMSDRIASAVGRRLKLVKKEAKKAGRRSDPFLVLIPIILVFLIETEAAESGEWTGLARGILAITAISGALAHLRFDNGKMLWRAASFALVLSAPVAFWAIVFTDKLAEAEVAPVRREGLFANTWDYINEMSSVSTNIEVAAASGSVVLLVVGLAWVLWPRKRTWETDG